MKREAAALGHEGSEIFLLAHALNMLQLALDLTALDLTPEISNTAVFEQQSSGEKQ